MPTQRFNDNPPDPQVVTTHTSQPKIEVEAEEMATKAGKVEKEHESSDIIGSVRSNSGGIFSK